MPIPSTAAAFGDSDIPTLLADMGISVTVGSVNGIALLDEADEILVQDADRGEVVVLATTLTVRTTDFPAAAIGQSVAVGSRNFTIRQRFRIGDGGLTKLWLSLVSGYPTIPPGIGVDLSLPNYDSGSIVMPTSLTAITATTTKVWRIILVNVTSQAQQIVALTDGNDNPYLEPNFPLAAGETITLDFGGATFANGVQAQAQNPNAIRIQVVGWQ